MDDKIPFHGNHSHDTRSFVFWGIVCVAANLFCTLSDPHDGDQSFWVGWIRSLVDDGLAGFSGNYPPLYVFWLWIVARIHDIFGITVGRTFLLKFLCLWPVYFAHLFLLDFAARLTDRQGLTDWQRNLVLAFIALNPAILLGGPVWGQVDLVPVVLALASLYCIRYRRTAAFALPLCALSILTKFQMVLFLPVFGGLLLGNWRNALKGLPFTAVIVLLVLQPFISGGTLGDMLARAYVDTTSQYPFATYNAANLWMLAAGNCTPDTAPLFGLSAEGPFRWLCPSFAGKTLFVLFSLFSFVSALRSRTLRRVFELATWNAVAFFVLLPQMHERYVLHAVAAAAIWLALDRRKSIIWVSAITAVASFNVSILCNGFHGNGAWTWLSILSVATMFFGAFGLFLPGAFARFTGSIAALRLPRYVPYVLLGACLLADGAWHVNADRTPGEQLGENEIRLTDLGMKTVRHGYGTPRKNRSVDNAALSACGGRYRHGIGTHAPSEICFELPEDAETLRIGAAIDDEVQNNGKVEFLIFGDDRLLWRSGPVTGRDREVRRTCIPVSGVRRLGLVTDPLGPDSYDHADWLSPVITKRGDIHREQPSNLQ